MLSEPLPPPAAQPWALNVHYSVLWGMKCPKELSEVRGCARARAWRTLGGNPVNKALIILGKSLHFCFLT